MILLTPEITRSTELVPSLIPFRKTSLLLLAEKTPQQWTHVFASIEVEPVADENADAVADLARAAPVVDKMSSITPESAPDITPMIRSVTPVVALRTQAASVIG
jgi:hypothetical protein